MTHMLLFYKKFHFCHLLPFAKVGHQCLSKSLCNEIKCIHFLSQAMWHLHLWRLMRRGGPAALEQFASKPNMMPRWLSVSFDSRRWGCGEYRSFIFECGAGFCLHIKIFFCDHDVILAFRNPCALIRFKSDSRLSALHSGRWVDKLVSMWASRSGTLSQSSPQVVKVCINLDNHVSKPIHCEQNISIMWMPRSSKWQKMEWRDPWHALRKSLFLCDYWTKSDGVFTDMIKVHYLHNFSFLPVLGIPQLVNISSIGLLSFRKTYL